METLSTGTRYQVRSTYGRNSEYLKRTGSLIPRLDIFSTLHVQQPCVISTVFLLRIFAFCRLQLNQKLLPATLITKRYFILQAYDKQDGFLQ